MKCGGTQSAQNLEPSYEVWGNTECAESRTLIWSVGEHRVRRILNPNMKCGGTQNLYLKYMSTRTKCAESYIQQSNGSGLWRWNPKKFWDREPAIWYNIFGRWRMQIKISFPELHSSFYCLQGGFEFRIDGGGGELTTQLPCLFQCDSPNSQPLSSCCVADPLSLFSTIRTLPVAGYCVYPSSSEWRSKWRLSALRPEFLTTSLIGYCLTLGILWHCSRIILILFFSNQFTACNC